MACGELRLYATRDSTITLVARRHVLGKTDPEPKSRTEGLTGDTESIVIPVESSWDRPLSLQLQGVTPILRNAAGNFLLSVASYLSATSPKAKGSTSATLMRLSAVFGIRNSLSFS
jgi:hypothetical protein